MQRSLPLIAVVHGPRTEVRMVRRTSMAQSEQVTCLTCWTDLGVETSAAVQVRVAPRRQPSGKITGGRLQWACAHCLARGKVTVMAG